MAKAWMPVLAVLALALAAGCAPKGPDPAQVRAAFERDLPPILEVVAFHVEKVRRAREGEQGDFVADVDYSVRLTHPLLDVDDEVLGLFEKLQFGLWVMGLQMRCGPDFFEGEPCAMGQELELVGEQDRWTIAE
jgi:hypothetical protein